MKYVDAGYAICLAVLFLYTVSVVMRRRRLTRADARRAPGMSGTAGTAGAPRPGVASQHEVTGSGPTPT
jgi:hypothetical protein